MDSSLINYLDPNTPPSSALSSSDSRALNGPESDVDEHLPLTTQPEQAPSSVPSALKQSKAQFLNIPKCAPPKPWALDDPILYEGPAYRAASHIPWAADSPPQIPLLPLLAHRRDPPSKQILPDTPNLTEATAQAKLQQMATEALGEQAKVERSYPSHPSPTVDTGVPSHAYPPAVPDIVAESAGPDDRGISAANPGLPTSQLPTNQATGSAATEPTMQEVLAALAALGDRVQRQQWCSAFKRPIGPPPGPIAVEDMASPAFEPLDISDKEG